MKTSNAADLIFSAVHADSRKHRSKRSLWLRSLPWLYLIFIIAVVACMRLLGERWWPATLMLFGPRWLALVPWTVLVGWSCRCHRRSLLPLAITGFVILGPLMDFCLPWPRWSRGGQPTIGILSCNVKGHCNKNDRLNRLVRQTGVDIVCLQGCIGPLDVDWPLDWNVLQKGELLFASRYPLRRVEPPSDLGYNNDHREKVLLCDVEVPQRELRLATVHLLSPHDGIVELIAHGDELQPTRGGVADRESDERWRQSQVIAAGLAVDAKIDVVVGDFNLTADDPIYRQYWSGFTDAFGMCGFGFGGTERPTPWFPFSIRIDHALSRTAWRPCNCWVEADVGSDHLPIMSRFSCNE